MSKQINFYMHPDDLKELELILREKWGLVFFSCSLPSSDIFLLDSISSVDPAGDKNLDKRTVLGCLPEHLEGIITHERPSIRDWTVNLRENPVLEFWRSWFQDDVLRRGRFYYHPEGQPESFVKTANAVIRHIRDQYEKQGGAYIGPAAKQWQVETGGQFMQL